MKVRLEKTLEYDGRDLLCFFGRSQRSRVLPHHNFPPRPGSIMPKSFSIRSWMLAALLVALVGLSVAMPVSAQVSSSESPKPKPPEQKLKPFEIGIELRWRPEWRDNADLQPANDFDGFNTIRTRINLTLRPHKDFYFFLQPQDAWVPDSRSDKVIHDLATNLHQAFFDWKIAGGKMFEFRGGRQEFVYGEERLLGAFGWDVVGRSWDGGRLRQKFGNWSSDYFWARLVDVKRNGARARAGAQDLTAAYFTNTKKDAPGRNEIYGIFLRDSLRVRGEIATNPLETVRIMTVGFRRLFQPKTRWRYSLENAWQFGERGPDGHFAAMVVFTGGYVWDKRWKPRAQFEYDYATGDNNPSNGKSREFHNLFPSNHYYYGYADLMGLRNMHGFRGTLAASPHPKFTFEFDYHHFLLAQKRGAWKNAGGRVLGVDATGNSGRDVGQELDFTARLPLGKHLNLLAGYSVFFPGGFAEKTRGPETHQFSYIQTTIRF